MHSPVAIFVYNRADNTRKTLEALMHNQHASETDVYVFSDGGKDERSWEKVNEVRRVLHEVEQEIQTTHALKSMTIVERPKNIYLERNIIEGIGYVLDRHETIIVLEDDIVTSPYFLDYMNQAFYIYKDDERVMHVSGFTNLDLPGDDGEEFYFTPHMSGWGWGTWASKWKQHFTHYQSREEALEGMTREDINTMQYDGVFPCLKSLDKTPIPWDICWEIAIYKAGGLCLTPYHTLVRNIGLDSGTHFRGNRWLQRYEFDREPLNHAIVVTHQPPEKDEKKEQLFKVAIRDWGIRYTWLGKTLRFFYKRYKRLLK
jgi:hypothetical protein